MVFAVDGLAEVGRTRQLNVSVKDPARPDGPGLTAARILVDVVDAGTVVGPAAGADVAVVASGSVFAWDVVGNDAAGDAVLDLGSLRIVSQPEQTYGPVSLTANADGTVTVDVSAIEGHAFAIFDGSYEVCDVNGVCATTDITIQPFVEA